MGPRKSGKANAANPSDFLDAAGRGMNFVTGLPYTSAYRDLARTKWAQLPVYIDPNKVAELLASLRENSVTVVISATGSGKSVIIPRLAMKFLHQEHDKTNAVVTASGVDGLLIRTQSQKRSRAPRLAMTFPKSVLASESAKYASQTWDVTLGKEVGYQFRGAPLGSHSSDTRALFMTDGTLFTMSRKDPLFRQFDLVILDEAHERSVQTDLLLARLKFALKARPELRLVIMSATIDPTIFTSYFDSAAVVKAAGQPTFPIEHHWEKLPVASDGFMNVAVERAIAALASVGKLKRAHMPAPTDVLVFVPTTKDATKGCRILHADPGAKESGVSQSTLCEGLYRRLADELKEVVIHGRPVAPMTNKLVFATPIAESSITLPSLGTVVDSGLQLSSVWLPLEQATRITRDMTSKAQIAQRVGRVGRVAPGVVYHIYTKQEFSALREFPDPAILHTNLAEHFLAELCVHGKGLHAVLEDCSGLLTPPTSDQTDAVVNTLSQLGLIDLDAASEITGLGRVTQTICDKYKLSLSNSLLLVGGALVDCRLDALVLACILEEVKGELSDLWSIEVATTNDPRTPLKEFMDPLSDHVSLVNVYHNLFMEEEEVQARGTLSMSTWNRIHERIERDRLRFETFDLRLDTTSPSYQRVAPPAASKSFPTPLIRVIAFARRHRQLVFSKKDLVGKASSAGPLQTCSCSAQTILATNINRPTPCLGGLYDDLIEVGGMKSFSLITWILAPDSTKQKSRIRIINSKPKAKQHSFP